MLEDLHLKRLAAALAARETFDAPPLMGYGTFNAWVNNDGVAKGVRSAVEVGSSYFPFALPLPQHPR